MQLIDYRLVTKQIRLYLSEGGQMKINLAFNVSKNGEKDSNDYLSEMKLEFSSGEKKVADIIIAIQARVNGEIKNEQMDIFEILKPVYLVHINSLLSDVLLPPLSFTMLNRPTEK